MKNDNHNLVDVFAGLGISRAEALTYMALLELETVSIRKIAAHTGINRGTTYDGLKKLIGLGLVSVRRRGDREQYTAEPPDKVFDIIRDKRRDLLDISAAAKKIVPDLMAYRAGRDGQPLVRYYQDDDGIVSILKDVLQTCRDLPQREYCAYSSGPLRHYLYRKFPQFTKRRIIEDIHVKVIAVGEGGELAEKAERRWLPEPDRRHASSYTIIYGNKVATVSITDNNIPYGVIIEDGGAASMQRLLFDHLWENINTESNSR